MGPADVHLTFGEIVPELERVATPELERVNSNQVLFALRCGWESMLYLAMAEHDSIYADGGEALISFSPSAMPVIGALFPNRPSRDSRHGRKPAIGVK